jgi:hypothetical protein
VSPELLRSRAQPQHAHAASQAHCSGAEQYADAQLNLTYQRITADASTIIAATAINFLRLMSSAPEAGHGRSARRAAPVAQIAYAMALKRAVQPVTAKRAVSQREEA